MKTIIIDYGAGNVRSVQFAFDRLGIVAELSNNEEVIRSADKVIFPGVGEASSAMEELRKQGLDKLIPTLKQPVLGVCLGMQLMCSYTEEGDTNCLDIFPTRVTKFTEEKKVPHMGWNAVNNLKGELFLGVKENEFMYFVHSFYAPVTEYTIATTDYGEVFSSALQKDNFYGCQFHPEKSGKIGQQVLANFLKMKS